MAKSVSPRIRKIIEALPIHKNSRILEIGCGPGVAAREIAETLSGGFILAIDRSTAAIAQAKKTSRAQADAGRLEFRRTAIEDFELQKGEKLFDWAFAIRVGALDGRHPEVADQALQRIANALGPKGKLYIDGGNPLKEVPLPRRQRKTPKRDR